MRNSPTAPMIARTMSPLDRAMPWKTRSPRPRLPVIDCGVASARPVSEDDRTVVVVSTAQPTFMSLKIRSPRVGLSAGVMGTCGATVDISAGPIRDTRSLALPTELSLAVR